MSVGRADFVLLAEISKTDLELVSVELGLRLSIVACLGERHHLLAGTASSRCTVIPSRRGAFQSAILLPLARVSMWAPEHQASVNSHSLKTLPLIRQGFLFADEPVTVQLR